MNVVKTIVNQFMGSYKDEEMNNKTAINDCIR
jgi:hypothetical protein